MSAPALAAYVMDTQRPLLKEALETCHSCFIQANSGTFPADLLEGINHMRTDLHLLFAREDVEMASVLDMVVNGHPIGRKELLNCEAACKQRNAELVRLVQAFHDKAIISRDEVSHTASVNLCYARLLDFEQDVLRHVFLHEEILFPKIYALSIK